MRRRCLQDPGAVAGGEGRVSGKVARAQPYSCASLNLALNLHLALDDKSTSAQSRVGVGARYGISASECHRRCIGPDRSRGPMSDTVGPASGGPPSSDSHDSVATVLVVLLIIMIWEDKWMKIWVNNVRKDNLIELGNIWGIFGE